MDDALQKIDQARLKLIQAFKETNDTAVQAKIKDQLSNLANLQDDVILDNLAGEAAALNRLSDILDQAISDIRGNISNLLLDDIQALNTQVSAAAKKKTS
jgi:NAD dependent epimerase/dehydratase family enzyme